MTTAKPRPSLAKILEIIEASHNAARLDAGFDSGEFSGPAHAEKMEADLDALGDWHPVLETAHAVGEWRWVLSNHPGAR